MEEAENQTGISNQQVSKWRKRLSTPDKYREALYGAAYKKAMAERGQSDLRGASGTGENEWFTPSEYVDAARRVLDGIDVDPATHLHAQQTIKAAQFFTKSDDGLKSHWVGTVWLNPPYAQPYIAEFAAKMVDEYALGNVSAAIMLTHNYTDTAWFQQAAKAAKAICFTRGRVKFYSPDGEIAAPTQGQAFFYFGDDVEKFSTEFSRFGFVVVPRG